MICDVFHRKKFLIFHLIVWKESEGNVLKEIYGEVFFIPNNCFFLHCSPIIPEKKRENKICIFVNFLFFGKFVPNKAQLIYDVRQQHILENFSQKLSQSKYFNCNLDGKRKDAILFMREEMQAILKLHKFLNKRTESTKLRFITDAESSNSKLVSNLIPNLTLKYRNFPIHPTNFLQNRKSFSMLNCSYKSLVFHWDFDENQLYIKNNNVL